MTDSGDERGQEHEPEDPEITVFVSRVPYSWKQKDLQSHFDEHFGKVASAKLMWDDRNERSKGMGFVTFDDNAAKEECLAKGKLKLVKWKHKATGTIKIYGVDAAVGESSAKTCFDWNSGRCKRGDTCNFWHDPDIAQKESAEPATKRAKKCWKFMKGKCKAGDACPLHHGEAPVRVQEDAATRPPRVCLTWKKKGRCGKWQKDKCKFDHPEEVAAKVRAKKERKKQEAAAGKRKKGGEEDKGETESLCVRVLGFPYETEPAVIRKLFAKCGEILTMEMPTFEDSGRSKGFCSFVFKTAAAVQAALKLDGEKVGPRWIKVEQGVMRRSWQALGRQKPENCNTIFVGNLDFNVVEDDLYRAFALCGPIKEVRLNAAKAFAFVQFKKKTAPEKAVALNGSKLSGRPMRIDYAEGKAETAAKGDKEKKPRKRQKHS